MQVFRPAGEDTLPTSTLDAIATGRFYILTHPGHKGAIQIRMEDILAERAPSLLKSLQPKSG